MIEENVVIDGRYGARIFITDFESKVTVDPHFHQEVELCFSIRGEKDQVIGVRTHHSNPRTLLLVNSNESHAIKTYGATSSVVLMVDYNMFLKYYPKFISYKFDLEENLESKIRIGTIMEEVYHHGINHKSFHIYDRMDDSCNPIVHGFEHLYLKAKIEEVIYLLLQNHLVDHDNSRLLNLNKKGIVLDTLEYVHKNYQRNLKLEEIALSLGYSPYYLSEVFSSYTGIKLFEYLNNYRMEQCLDHLSHSYDDLGEIAVSNGFGTYRSFYNLFKKSYGMTPSAYRNKIQR